MQIKSNRQFRNYVISWFLIISGVIVIIVGIGVYKSAENYLINNFKQEKLTQVTAMASLINAEQHHQFKNKKSVSSHYFQQLVKSFTKYSMSNGYHYPPLTVNYDNQADIFRYAVDPVLARNDIIQIIINKIEVLISKDSTGNIKLLRNGNYVDNFEVTNGMQSFSLQIVKLENGLQLQLNGQTIFYLNSKLPLSGQYENIVIDRKTEETKIAIIRLVDVETRVNYRFVAQGELLHLPGIEYHHLEIYPKKTLSILKSKNLNKKAQVIEFKDTTGLYFIAPIANTATLHTGFLILKVSHEKLAKLSEDIISTMILSFSLFTIFLMSASIFFARKITHPLEQLTGAISRLIQNDFNFKLSAKKFGSFGYLAKQFNLMLTRIQASRSELIHLNKSYSRFVPHQLLKQLSSSGVVDISLGDCCERQMTILFCDIRGFTSLSESMSPTASFRFINRYLEKIAPVINKHAGIIDKYMGDGIMALFPKGADSALQAAIEMLNALALYNKKLIQKNLPAIEIGLGLHSGKMMLGTVGTPSRMDATVISDTVNAAARVESMTKAFCTKILITEETKRQLQDLSSYRIRYIASCQIPGKSKPVTLYEVFNNDSYSLQKEKSQNQVVLIKAWNKYKEGDSVMAIQMYQQLIEKSPNDKSILALIERCQSGRL